MGPIALRRPRLVVAFTNAAVQYWLTAFPLARREMRRWRRRAQQIPDPVLRRIALETLDGEGGNLEGAAAFAAFAPLRTRAAVVRAAVAFQATYDYVDSLAEQPSAAPATNARALHEALRVALCPSARHGAYYRHHTHRDDGGYLGELVDGCRTAMRALPSARAIESQLAQATERMIDYQALVHDGESSRAALAAWAGEREAREAALTWWETAAARASSLGVFALFAAAAQERMSSRDAAAIDAAYFPWIGALHVLLDSLADQAEDARSGHVSLVGHYASAAQTADRLTAIAAGAFTAARGLGQGERHAILLAATAAFYLSSPSAQPAPAGRQVLASAGDLARPTLLVLGARRRIARLRRAS